MPEWLKIILEIFCYLSAILGVAGFVYSVSRWSIRKIKNKIAGVRPENERAKDVAQRVERFELLENKLNRMKAAIIIDDGKIKASGREALNRIHDWVIDVCKKGEKVGFLGNYTDRRYIESFNEWGIEFIKTAYLLWSELFPPDLYPEELKRYALRMLESLMLPRHLCCFFYPFLIDYL